MKNEGRVVWEKRNSRPCARRSAISTISAIILRCPSDSATEHLRRCRPWNKLKSAWYSYQFGINPEIASALVAAGAKRSYVELVSSEHFLHVGTN